MYPAKPYIIITRTLYDKFARQRSKGRSERRGRGQQGRREKNRRKKEPNQQPNRHFQNRIYVQREVQPSSHSRLYVPNNRLVINSRFVRPPYIYTDTHPYRYLIGIRPVPSIGRKFSHCHFGTGATGTVVQRWLDIRCSAPARFTASINFVSRPT